jgi:hypothetical protein
MRFVFPAIAIGFVIAGCSPAPRPDLAYVLRAPAPAPVAQARATWVPGHWRKVDHGMVWIEGHWT